jgi:hypothetical protein
VSELSEAEKTQIVELCKQVDASTGGSDTLDHALRLMNMSTHIPYVATLESIDRMIADAFVIPLEYFEATEKVGSRVSLDSSGHRPRMCAPK